MHKCIIVIFLLLSFSNYTQAVFCKLQHTSSHTVTVAGIRKAADNGPLWKTGEVRDEDFEMGENNWDYTEAKQHKFSKGVLKCGQTLARSLGTLVCQVVGFTSKPKGFDMKRLYQLERALWNTPGRQALLWQWRGGNAG